MNVLAVVLVVSSILVETTSAQCTGPEFFARSAAVTAACCDDDHHPCAGGLPSSCNAKCAAVLLPMQHDCADMVTMMGMADVIDTAAAECPRGPPPPPCSNGPEFFAYTQLMTAACCGDSSSACASGFPTAACSADCAAVLLPMQAVCGSLLTMMGMDATFSTAAAACANPTEAAPDPCASSPCLNGGVCSTALEAGNGHRILQGEGFVCVCELRYSGTQCETAAAATVGDTSCTATFGGLGPAVPWGAVSDGTALSVCLAGDVSAAVGTSEYSGCSPTIEIHNAGGDLRVECDRHPASGASSAEAELCGMADRLNAMAAATLTVVGLLFQDLTAGNDDSGVGATIGGAILLNGDSGAAATVLECTFRRNSAGSVRKPPHPPLPHGLAGAATAVRSRRRLIPSPPPPHSPPKPPCRPLTLWCAHPGPCSSAGPSTPAPAPR